MAKRAPESVRTSNPSARSVQDLAHQPEPPANLNLAVVVGHVAGAIDRRSLPSGTEVLSLSVTVRSEASTTASVPVSWFDPPERASFAEGDHVLVVGRVTRRFYRAGGAMASRTDVEAESITPLRRKATVTKLFDRVIEQLATT